MKKPIKTSDETGAIEFIPNQVEDIHDWLMMDTSKPEGIPYYYGCGKEIDLSDTRTMREVLLSIESLLKEICQKR